MELLSNTIENIEKVSIDSDGNIKNRFSKLSHTHWKSREA